MNANDRIPAEKFAFVQLDTKIHDVKFETKPIGYLHDAWNRFCKNKGSVVAAVIIGLLLLFAIVVPAISRYDVAYRDGYYQYCLPRSKVLSKIGIMTGNFKKSVNKQTYDFYSAIPGALVKASKPYTKEGKTYYDIVIDSYAKVGYIYKNCTAAEYEALLAYEAETGRQIVYPMVDISKSARNDYASDANYWFEHDQKGLAVRDMQGNLKNIFLTDETSPDGYAYHVEKQGGMYQIRVLYSEYYEYIHGFGPSFLFGTDQFGQDILVCLASGARLSFILSFCVAIVNFLIGSVYGAVEGYYGGRIDLIMERISDVLVDVPFIVVASLFQLHLARKVGAIPSLLFAFVLTGWIGTASRVRTQFYRFKGQEYVLAARTLGARDARIIFRHIFPNALGTIITSSVLMIPGVIFTESMLSYLGIVDLQTSSLTSVGTLLANGQSALSTFPHAIFFPALFISLLEISFNIFGNGLRDAFNPSLRGADE